jgi:calcineurin-binding protein cabin-1
MKELCGDNRHRIGLCFLKLAHDQLGCLSLCCHDDGSFLHHIVALLRKELKNLTSLPSNLREVLLIELEQCYYCLYGYPYKKAKQRGLAEHNSFQVSLTWDGSLKLVEFFHPSYLPSIMDVKSPQVTSELMSLYKKIIETIPTDQYVISLENIQQFIEGTENELLILSSPKEHSSIIGDIYYLLADDSLKSMDNNKAIKYYQLNLSYCPNGFDAWAGLALAYSRKITDKLNNRDSTATVEKFIAKNVPLAIRCFQKALTINDKNCFIVEKFGFFCYAVQSFASQVNKLVNSKIKFKN